MERLASQLREAGRRPYVVPIGGSSALGTWGYVEITQRVMIHELEQQEGGKFSDITYLHARDAARAACLHDFPKLFFRTQKQNF